MLKECIQDRQEFERDMDINVQQLLELKNSLETSVEILKGEVWALNEEIKKVKNIAKFLFLCSFPPISPAYISSPFLFFVELSRGLTFFSFRKRKCLQKRKRVEKGRGLWRGNNTSTKNF